MRRDVFQAIADPTRRAIIDLLARAPMNVNSVSENFNISRPAVSKHMRILVECGLVTINQQGRERYCYAYPKRLKEVNDWLQSYEKFWNKKLDALDDFLQSDRKKSRLKTKR